MRLAAPLLVLGAWLAASVPAGGAEEGPGPFALAPGVVVDPARSRLYLMAPGGAVEAVDAATGTVVWTAAGSGKPLALRGRTLAVHAEGPPGPTLRIALLDVEGSGEVARTFEVRLPQGVLTPVGGMPGKSFSAEADLGATRLFVRWRFARQAGTRREAMAPPAGHEQEGAFAIDLGTGEASEGVSAPSDPGPPVPEALKALEASRRLRSMVFGTPTVAAGAVLEEVEAGGRWVLKRYDRRTGTPLADVVLGTEPRANVVPSADRRTFRFGWTDLTTLPPVQRWTLYSVETGEVLGRYEHRSPAAAFAVVGRTLVFESKAHTERTDGETRERPLEIRGVPLAGEGSAWSRPLRDTAASGDAPPAR